MPTRITISKEWTDKERLIVLGMLGNHVISHIQLHGSLTPSDQFDFANRVRTIVNGKADFLNVTKSIMLRGLPVEVEAKNDD